MFVIEHWWYLPQQFSLLETKKIFWINLFIQANLKMGWPLNNVRFSGINIGTVDGTISFWLFSSWVSMTIEKKYKNSLKQMLKLALDQTDWWDKVLTIQNPFEKKWFKKTRNWFHCIDRDGWYYEKRKGNNGKC
jgi:hypothetical protein